MNKSFALRRRCDVTWGRAIHVAMAIMLLALLLCSTVTPAYADNFTDVFYTNSFRGSFEWFKHLDWIGMVVQAVISVFALVGTALIVIRIMTSLLYLSARGLWEEVHDLKQSGTESELYDLGMVSMVKSWAKGKSGTGLDAFIGAILMLLPDVKRYSDFGEKSGSKFEEDTSMSQYMLKILLPTVLAVFFLAMAFNGTLVKGLAVTVDAMGTLADRGVSINYAGFIDDLINKNIGYQFVVAEDGTQLGRLTGAVQKEVYGKVVARFDNPDESTLYLIGKAVEDKFKPENVETAISNASTNDIGQLLHDSIFNPESGGETVDRYFSYITADVIVGGSQLEGADLEGSNGILCASIGDILDDAGFTTGGGGGAAGTLTDQFINVKFRQGKTFTGSYFNTGEVAR